MRAVTWAVRGYLGEACGHLGSAWFSGHIKSFDQQTFFKLIHICRGMSPLRVLWWFDDSKGGFQSQSHARNPWRNDWCFASLMFWWFVCFQGSFSLYIPPFIFPLIITCVYMSFLLISCVN